MKTRAIAAALLVALAPVTFGAPAFAQPAEDPITKQARARFQEGVDFYDKGQYDNARASFLQAYALKKHPAVLLNLAQSSAKAGHPLEASKYFRQYLREATSATPQQRQDAEAGLAEVRQKLGHIEITAPPGTDLSVDNESVGAAPLAEGVDVEPGSHTVKGGSETVAVTVSAGQKAQATFGSGAPAAAVVVPPAGGTDTPATPPPAATTPPSDTTPPPARDSGVKRTNILSPPDNMIPVYIGLGAGVAGLVGTIVFASAKASAQDSADVVAQGIRDGAAKRGLSSQGICSSTDAKIQADFGQACRTLQENNDKVDTNALVANISAGVMIVGFVGAAGWYLLAPKKDDPKPAALRPSVAPIVGFGTTGLSVSGSF